MLLNMFNKYFLDLLFDFKGKAGSINSLTFIYLSPLFISKPCTPCYKKSILGSKQPVSGNLFFCRFSLRLSENNRSRVKFMAKFGPTASNFGYIIFPIFG